MTKKRKRIIILIAVLLIFMGAILLGIHLLRQGYFPGVVETWNDMVFSKTIEDFPDRVVVNLDEQSDTNFIVYAKDVKAITAEDGKNRIVSADEENLVYTIAEPDEQITTLKKGDVFYIEPNEYYAMGIAVKVKKITVEEGNVVIQGKEFGIGELIEYADVDMDFPITEFYVDSSEIGEDFLVQWVEGEDLAASAHNTSAQMVASAGDTSLGTTALAEGRAVKAEAKREKVPFWKYELPIGEFDTPGEEVSTGFNIDWDVFHASGRLGLRMDTMHVTFKVRPVLLTTIMETRGDYRFFVNGELRCQADGSVPLKLPTVIFPLSGPMVLRFTPAVSLDFSGSVGGSIDTSVGVQIESGASYSAGLLLMQKPSFTPLGVSNDTNLIELKGTLALNIVRGELGFGIPCLAELYVNTESGVVMEGTGREVSAGGASTAESDSYHECDYCVDGDVYIQAKVNAGFAVDLVNGWKKIRKQEIKEAGAFEYAGTPDEKLETATMTTDDGEIYRFGDSQSFRVMDFSWTMLDVRIDFPLPQYRDFYLSLRSDYEPEFGWGECPHLLWRTEITAETTDGVPVDDAVVTAYYPDGRTEVGTVKSGKAVMYLPGGKNSLACEQGVLADMCEVEVNDAVTTAKLVLEDERDLFIILDYYEDIIDEDGCVLEKAAQSASTYPDIKQKLQKRYPEAQIMTGMEWDGTFRHDCSEFKVDEHRDKGLSRGDVIVIIDIYDAQNVYQTYVERECFEVRPQGMQFYELSTGIVLEDENGFIRGCKYYQAYLHRGEEDETIQEESYPFRAVNSYTLSYGADVYEHIPVSPIMDEEYCLIERREDNEYRSSKLTFPLEKMLEYHYYNMYMYYGEKVTDFALESLYPYIDDLWYNETFE